MASATETAALALNMTGLPGAALDAAIEAARLANPMVTGLHGRLHIALPGDFRLHQIPDAVTVDAWPKSRVTVDDRASLVAYANRFSDPRSVIIADYDKGTISARLDWHGDNQLAHGNVGPDEHSVTLKLRLSEEFQRWNAIEGKLQDQEDFARFLEENSSDIVRPDPATMIEISRDFEATVGQTYKSAIRLENGDRRMVFESETKISRDVIIPERFTLGIPIYNGEEPDELTCLFRWRAAGGGVIKLGFQWHRVEYQRRAHFALIARTAAEETGLPVFMGRRGDAP